MRGFGRALLALVVMVMTGCDAGPSAVLPDGGGETVVVEDRKAPVWAERKAEPEGLEQASMAVTDPPKVEAEAPKAGKVAITETRYGDWPLWSKNRKYSAYENATYHYEKHGAEFGAVSYDDWVGKVHGFIHNPPKGTQTLRRRNGDTLFYDPKGNVFAVMTKQGAPRTMFRPDNGAAYWQKQKQIEADRKLGRDPKPADE
jgi:pyocin large subunit-like protein